MSTAIHFSHQTELESLHNSVFLLQVIPGCETEIKSLSKKIIRQFKNVEEKVKDIHTIKVLDDFVYQDNGACYHIDKPESLIILPSWEPTLLPVDPATKKPKKSTKQPFSLIFLKTANPIWYLQLSDYSNRRASFQKCEKINYQDDLAKYYLMKDLGKIEKEILEFNNHRSSTFNKVSRFLRLFDIYIYALGKYRDVDKSEVPFFFLNDEELEGLYNAFSIDKPQSSTNPDLCGYHHGSPFDTISKTLANIIKNPSEDRVYFKSIERKNQSKYHGHPKVFNHDLYFEEMNAQLMTIPPKYLILLKKIGFQYNENFAKGVTTP